MTIQVRSQIRRQIERNLVIPKGVYFCFYAAGSSLIPYLALYYQEVGLSAQIIGLLAGLPPLITLFAAPLWGGVADATHRHRQLLLLAMAGAVTIVLIMSRAVHLLPLLLLVILYAFFAAPIIPLVDNSVLALLGPHKALYGKQRVWGAVGWGCSAAVMGLIIERMGLGWAFYGYALFMSLGLLLASRLTVSEANIGRRFWHGLQALLLQRQWVIFLLAVLASSMTAGMYHSFLFLTLDGMGAGKPLMGMSLVFATISELPVFFYADRLLGRFGPRGLLILAMGAAVVRMFAYALMVAPWQALLINLLHGLTFSAMWAAGVAQADALAPPGLGATAQGMFTAVAMGIAAALGAMLGGILFQRFGPSTMFAVGGGIVLAGLLLYVTVGRNGKATA